MWNDIKRIYSSNANVSKYIFTKDDAIAESVLYKYPTYQERTVICCSTQSGCPVGCRFCGTGEYFVRSFDAKEIVSQPVKLLEDTGVDPKTMGRLQIMFMSMGEPLLNLKNLIPALHSLNAMYPNAALLISSIGPRIDYEPLLQVASEIPTLGLQFSIHESTDDVRNNLIPFKSKLTLAEISDMGERFFARTAGRTPFFNYCVHDKNNTVEDAERLLSLFDPNIWQATISVICERDETINRAHERQQELVDKFQELLKERNYRTRVFNPAGQDDIAGGCGQLHQTQKWFKDNPNMARPTVGYGLPVIHSPQELNLPICNV